MSITRSNFVSYWSLVCFIAEPIKALFRVADNVERKASLQRKKFIVARMEYDHLSNASVANFIVTADERLQMQIADRAAGETAELQVNKLILVGNGYVRSVYVGRVERRKPFSFSYDLFHLG
jgi:hypothetical protein